MRRSPGRTRPARYHDRVLTRATLPHETGWNLVAESLARPCRTLGSYG